jgi:hypothetical protein
VSALSGKQVLAGAAVVVVAAAIATGIFLLGPPSQERARRLDERRVSDLQGMSSSARLYYKRSGRFPASREELTKEPGVILETRDPVTEEPYAYRVVDSATYELCAAFDRPSADRVADIWSHGAGRQCFTLKADETR